MLIVPERNTILILPPRTGSTTLHNAIRQKYPASFMLYRHAERDAIPPGYESLKVVGFVRNPFARMWSLYKFLSILDPMTSATWAQEEVMRLLESVQGKSFEEWLTTNQEPFLPSGTGHPGLFQLHYKPETRKSQFEYLRPDLGTVVWPFTELPALLEMMELPQLRECATTDHVPYPPMTDAIAEHIDLYMSWENAQGVDLI